MQPSFFREMPKFKTPDEELDYLRAHVAKREEELIQAGHFEHTKDSAAKEVVGTYKNIPASEVLHSSNIINQKETEGIVLALKPEIHDNVMEELLGIVITKGIRNALSVVEAMGNPHVEDDFHRLLVQYLKTGQVISDLKEGTPLYKSLNMTLFEVTLPPPTDGRISPRVSKNSSAPWSNFMPVCSLSRWTRKMKKKFISRSRLRSGIKATK